MSSPSRTDQPYTRIPVPESLFQMCIQLVAKNLDLVESFQGFPSLIGEKIFRCAINSERFNSDSDYESLSLKLFTDAFRDEVLSLLNVYRQYLGLNYYIENFLMFKDLTELDVSYCGLGDDHEILTHISTLKSLGKLALSHNALTDSGVQRMTTAHRMFRRGPEHLLHIDLTGNRVSLRCLKFLSSFRELQNVLLPLQPHDAKQSVHQWQLKKSHYRPIKITTKGWAASVIDKWMKHASTRRKPAKHSQTGNFYSKSALKSVYLETKAKNESAEPPLACLLATRAASAELTCSDIVENNMKTSTNRNSRYQVNVKTEHKLNCFIAGESSDSELLGLYQTDESSKEKAPNAVEKSKNVFKHSSTSSELKLDTELLKQYTVDSNAHNSFNKGDSKLLNKLTGNDENLKSNWRNLSQSIPKLLITKSDLKDSRGCNMFQNKYKASDIFQRRRELKSDNHVQLNPNKKRRVDR